MSLPLCPTVNPLGSGSSDVNIVDDPAQPVMHVYVGAGRSHSTQYELFGHFGLKGFKKG